MSSHPPIRTIRDIEALERVPLEERIVSWDVYELIRRGAARDPDKTALIHFDDADIDVAPFTLTHRELMGRFNQAANLFHRLGVGPGDAVCTLLPTVPQVFYAQMGGIAAGISCCVNWMLEPAALVDILTAARCKVLIALGPEGEVGIWDKVAALRERLPEGLPRAQRRRARRRSPAGQRLRRADGGGAGRPADLRARARSGRSRRLHPFRRHHRRAEAHRVRLLHRGLCYKMWANSIVNGAWPA